MPAVGVVADDVKLAIYAPGDDNTGLAGGTGGPCTGALIVFAEFFIFISSSFVNFLMFSFQFEISSFVEKFCIAFGHLFLG